MIRDFSKRTIIWSRHALKEALEDDFSTKDIEKSLAKSVELYLEPGKKKAVTNIGTRYCTVIFIDMKYAIKIITCWEASYWEIEAYNKR